MENKKVLGVSNSVFAATAAILIVLVIVGFSLYATKPTTTPTATVPTTINVPTTVTSYTTVYSTTTKTVPIRISGGFLDGQVITFTYYGTPALCVPPLTKFFPNETQANTTAMGCEAGAADMSAFPPGSAPFWVLVPAFAGLSVFGVHQLGATAQGFPTFIYNGVNYTILTQCGATGTPAECPDHMAYIYSPLFTAVEEHLGIKNGVFGLPEGVLPTPAHDHIVTFSTNQSIPWYTIVVLVFDPNIFPNPITGQCQAVVPSNLSDPTANCLNSFSALEAALTTHSSAVSAANANNPIWQTLGEPTLQVVVPGISSPSQLMNANSNMVVYFGDPAVYPYPTLK